MKTKLFTLLFALTVNIGSLSAVDTITVSRALEIGSSLTNGQTTSETYNIVGYVSTMAGNTTDYANYGNQTYWITDDPISSANSNSTGAFYVYRGVASQEVKLRNKVCITTPIYKYTSGVIESVSYSDVTILGGLCGDHLTWNLTDGVLTISGTGDMINWSGRSYVPWYTYRENITSVTIENGVTSIGNYAFFGCSGLTSVTIPNSVTSVGSGAFLYCFGLTSVTIPNSVTSIGNHAFYSCSGLTSPVYNAHVFAYMPSVYAGAYTIPDGIESIAGGAFFGCSGLTSVTIPNSVTSIGIQAFTSCSSLKSVVWNAKNCQDFSSNSTPFYREDYDDLCNQIISFVFGEEVEHIPAYLCVQMTNLTSIKIPNNVTTIGDYAFYGCSGLTSVTLNSNYIVGKTYTSDSNINSIFGTQVTEYIIGDDVTTIGNYAFYGCTGLTNMEIPNNVTSIGNNAFYGCSNITSVIWNAKNCNSWNFGSQVETFMFGDSVEVIPANLCNGMNKPTKLVFPTSLKSIGEYAFKGWTKIKQINVPNEVETIGAHAFDSCIFFYIYLFGQRCFRDWRLCFQRMYPCQ